MQDKLVEKEVWCLFMAKPKTLRWNLLNSRSPLEKMTKSAFAKAWLKSAGREELYFRLCTGTVPVMLWVAHALQVVVNHKHIERHSPSTAAQLQQHHSAAKDHTGLWIPLPALFVPSVGQTELSSKHPHGCGIPMRLHLGVSVGGTDAQAEVMGAYGTAPSSPGRSASVWWGQMLPGISPPTHALK